MGGDEVDKANWKKCADCQKRIKTEGLKSPEELQAWFVRKMESFFKANGKHLIGWDEVGDDGLTSDATIMRYLSYKPLTAPAIAANMIKKIHLLCRKLIPSFFPERLSRKNEMMASSTPTH